MSDEIKTYGQIAYEAYRAASDGKSLVSGQPLPGWDEQDERIAEAWMAAGRAVDEQVRTDGIDPGDTKLGGILQRLDNLATGMEASARASRPSKKSEIEQGCAAAVRAIIGDAVGTAGDGQPADLGDLFLEWLGEEFEIVADAGYEESDLKHAFIAGHGAAVQATPASIPLRLARCPEHPGKVHAQAGSAGEWACLRGLADTAEAGVPGQGDLVTANEELGEALTQARAKTERLELEMAEAGAMLAALLPEILAAIDKFEADLGFTAPELTGMRIGQLRSMVRGIFEPEDDEDHDDD